MELLENAREKAQQYAVNGIGYVLDLRQKPYAIAGIALALVAGAGLVATATAGSHANQTSAPSQAFFSTDDGATTFAAPETSKTPFDHNGGKAFRAHVVRCGSGEPFVTYLQRPTPPKAGNRPETAIPEIKPPRSQNWVPMNDLKRSSPLLNTRCPDGSTPTSVSPK